MKALLGLSLILGIFSINSIVYSEEIVRVATASNFLFPMKELKYQFQLTSGYLLKISSGSTAKLYAQILHGAPFDVFLAADAITVQKLIKMDAAIASSEFTYATGKLALWAAGSGRNSTDLKNDLLHGDFSRLAIANPKLAPYGRAAMDVLRNLNLARRLKKESRLVFGENIAQVHQLIHSGGVKFGLVSLSQLKFAGLKILENKRSIIRNIYWEIPSHLHQPIKQSAVLLARARNSVAAKAFLAFLKSPKIQQQIIERYGYQSSITFPVGKDS